MAHSRGFWFVLLTVLMIDVPAIACTESCYGFSYLSPPDSCFTDVTFDRCVAPFGTGGGCLRWNLPEGSWRVGAPYNNLLGGIRALVTDSYTIEGPASALPIAVDIQLHLQGEIYLGCAGLNGALRLEVEFVEGSSNPVTLSHEMTVVNCGDSRQLDTILTLHASHLVGQPFRVASDIIAGAGYGTIEVTGNIAFEVPDGYHVVSCQGFSSEPVSIEAATWTRTKALYRQ